VGAVSSKGRNGGKVPNQHLPQLNKITMFLIIHFDNTPGILSCSDDSSIASFDGGIGTDDCEGDFGHDFSVLGDGFVVVEFVAGGFEDLDLVVVDVGEDLVVSEERAKRARRREREGREGKRVNRVKRREGRREGREMK